MTGGLTPQTPISRLPKPVRCGEAVANVVLRFVEVN